MRRSLPEVNPCFHPIAARFAAIASLSLALAGGALDARGQIATLTATADTSIMEGAPFNNLGAVQSLAIGVTANGSLARGLVRFDVAGSLPANARVSTGYLTLSVVRAGFLVEDGIYSLHRVRKPWGEGTKGSGILTGTGVAATAGEATWISRFHPSTNWVEGGAKLEDDYDLEVSAIAFASAGLGNTIVFTPNDKLAADLQGWMADPASNHGWIIRDIEEGTFSQTARRFGSRENSTPTARPTLSIEYSTAPNALEIRNVRLIEFTGQICFDFAPTVGKAYGIERRSNVDSGQWVEFTTIPAVTSPGTLTVCDQVAPGTRFYRVVEK